MNDGGVVIVGAGLAGVSCAAELRAQGFTDPVTLLNGETAEPYDRPPLSKGYASGQQSLDDIRLQASSWYQEQNVRLENDCVVASVDVTSQSVTCTRDRVFQYEHLVLATGSRARELPIEGLDGGDESKVHYIRTLADSDKVKAALKSGRRFLFVGGGVIGMELAATVAQAGCKATVIEAQANIMGRFFPASVSDFLGAVHRDRGVEIVLNEQISEVSLAPGKEIQVELGNGETYLTDELVIGVGALPNTEVAEAMGLEVSSGIVVDEYCRTSLPQVYACGDVAEFQHPRYGRVRWENWKHAQQHGRHAARCILGGSDHYDETPWIWTDQYDLNIQTLGFHQGCEDVLRGETSNGRFTVFHLRDGRVCGATFVNDVKSKKPTLKLIERSAAVDPGQLADVSTNLRKI